MGLLWASYLGRKWGQEYVDLDQMAPKTRSQTAELLSDPAESKFLKGVRHRPIMADAMHTLLIIKAWLMGSTWMPPGGNQRVAELLRWHALKLDAVTSGTDV